MALWVVPSAWADVPTNMNVQGKLTDGGGAPSPAGLYFLTFRIFDAEIGGAQLWPSNGANGETQTLPVGAEGLWNGCVGADSALTEAVFQDTSRWLEVTVDNGVDPAETLPRIKLKTNPFTYRSASSQNADAVGGLDLTDLTDKFVEVVGDTMSGVLKVEYAADSVEALVMADNQSPADIWSFAPATRGLGAIATSDGTEFKAGVIALAGGADGNKFGTFGIAIGPGPSNTGVYGEAHGADKNWGGYFFGDLFVSGAGVGDTAVMLPDDAIGDDEILDEPGIAQGRNGGDVAVTGNATMIDIITVTITIPDGGYIVVDAQAQARLAGTTLSNYMAIQVDEIAGGGLDGTYQYVGMTNPSSTGSMWLPVHAQRTYLKPAGTYTFRLEASHPPGNGTANMWHAVITARYFPRSYGAVAAVTASRDVDEFDAARAVRSNAGAQNGTEGTSEQFFEVDLRELELKLARAEAVTHKAKADLISAQMQVQSQVRSTATQGDR